jgi:hypothetical protein
MVPVGSASDPCVTIRRDDDALQIDDGDGAARGQLVKLQGVLEVIEHRADGQHRPYLAALVLDGACNVDDLVSASRNDRNPDRRRVVGQSLVKIDAVVGVGTRIVRILRCPDIGAVEIEQQDVGIAVGQLAFDLPQQRIIGGPIGRVEGDGLAEHRQQVFKRADMVIDLTGQQPGLVDRVLGRRSSVVLPLNPERGRHEGGKRNHGRERRAQQSRSYAAKKSHAPIRFTLMRIFPGCKGRKFRMCSGGSDREVNCRLDLIQA